MSMPHVPDCHCPYCRSRRNVTVFEHWLVAALVSLALWMGGRAAIHFFG